MPRKVDNALYAGCSANVLMQEVAGQALQIQNFIVQLAQSAN
jgi:hypothetical protein